MRRLLYLTAISLFVFSCAKKDDILNLQNQIDALKSDQIASIETQIERINGSISALESMDTQLNGYITTLQTQQQKLEQTDGELAKSISDLKTELYSKISEEKTALLAQMSADKQELLGKITSAEGRLTSLENRAASLENKDADLQKQIDAIKNDISSLQGKYESLVREMGALEGTLRAEISASQTTVLNQLESYKTGIDTQLQTITNSIAALESKDTELNSKIENLKSYVDEKLQSTKDWASATFATLEQFNSVSTTVSGIQAQIETINSSITKLSEKAASDKEELLGKISSLESKTATDIASALETCGNNLASAKTEITNAYTQAISTAISTLETSMKVWVNTQLTKYYTITQVDELLSAMKTTLDGQLNNQKLYLEGLITTLQGELTTRINANASAITDLQSRITNPGMSESALVNQVIQNSVNISTNSQAIATNAKNIEEGLAANKTLIEANAALIQENADAITKLDGEMAAATQAIADNASDIAANAALISANATAISNNAKAISDNAADIVSLRTDLEKAKTDITSAYNSAIASAISASEGKISGQIETEVATINTRITNEIKAVENKISALADRVSACEQDIDKIKNDISDILSSIEQLNEKLDEILNRIQSISVLPTYSDGSVEIRNEGLTEIRFEISPRSASVELAKLGTGVLSLDAITTQTKSSVFTNIPIRSVRDDGELFIISVDGTGLGDEFFGNRSVLSARMKIIDSHNTKTTDYFLLRGYRCIDLSQDGTANCYIVSQSGKYKFKATKGNTEESVGNISTASVLWESNGTLTKTKPGEIVDDVKYDGQFIYFTATQKKGNAVIAAKDETGNILWTWHIWLTDQPIDQTYKNNAGTMMDRNLGAVSARPGDILSGGLYYQWGRKDPFVRYQSSTTAIWSSLNNSSSTNYDLEYTNSNPMQIIRRIDNTHQWNNEKTVSDPCPYGYRVPDVDVFTNAMAAAGGQISAELNGGLDFGSTSLSFGTGVIWYPAAGKRDYESVDDLKNISDWGRYWTCSVSGSEHKNFYFYKPTDGVVQINCNSTTDYSAYSVRCMKE